MEEIHWLDEILAQYGNRGSRNWEYGLEGEDGDSHNIGLERVLTDLGYTGHQQTSALNNNVYFDPHTEADLKKGEAVLDGKQVGFYYGKNPATMNSGPVLPRIMDPNRPYQEKYIHPHETGAAVKGLGDIIYLITKFDEALDAIPPGWKSGIPGVDNFLIVRKMLKEIGKRVDKRLSDRK